MTFISNDIHDIYNKDQQSKQDHDSHQQLSYTICTINIYQQHQDQQPVHVHREKSHLNKTTMWINKYNYLHVPRSSNIMPTMHY